MNRKIFTVVMGLALVIAFFLPYVDFFGGTISGFDIVKSDGGTWQKYIYLVFPISGLLLTIGALNNGNYAGGRSLWAWLPLLGVLYFLIISPMIDGQKIGDVFKYIGKGYGVGLWITIVVSLILPFYNPKS